MAGEPVQVEVFYDDAEELEKAKAALTAVRPDVRIYKGVIEGWADDRALAALAEASLLVSPLLHPSAAPAPEAVEANAAGAPPPRHDTEELLRLKQHSRYVTRTDEGLRILAQEVASDAVDQTVNDPGHRDLEPAPEDAPDNAVYHIHLRAPMTEAQCQEIEGLGISLAAFEPPMSYRTFLTRDQYATVRSLPYVSAVKRFRLEETVTRALLDALPLDAEPSGGDTMLLSGGPEETLERETFDVVLHRIADREKVEGEIRMLEGAELLESSHLYIRFSVPKDPRILAALAKLPEIRRISVYSPPELFADRARAIVGVDTLEPVAGGDLNGDGEKVAVFDSGIDRAHPDLADRVDSIEKVEGATEEDEVGHGTHVAGIIAGTGAASGGKIRGMAPGAKLAVIGVVKVEGSRPIVLTPANWATLLQRAVDKGAKIVNLSTGRGAFGDYDFGSLSMDEFVYEHPDVLVVVAAGNEGSAPEGFPGFKTVFSPASAKNVLTVGASCSDRKIEPPLRWREYNPQIFAAPCGDEPVCGNADLPAALSSRGPTEFDSVKPDLVAPGTQILAAKAAAATLRWWKPPFEEHGGKYGYLGGTSMAAPVVSGAAAVLRQYLRVACAKPDPSAALMKAILIAGARKIQPRSLPEQLIEKEIGFPDFDQGFGRLDLASVLPGPASPRRKLLFVDWARDSDEALISRPEDVPGRELKRSRTYCFTVVDQPKEPVQVVLTWTDWPSSHVQNNLHLELTGPEVTMSGNPYHVYRRQKIDEVLQAYVDPRRLGAQKFPVIDKNNNVEKITIEAPEPGEYDISVLAQNTPFAPQGYALCVVGEIDGDLKAVA
ncbi:MAG TPA: S8 family serine peptidase [Actinomycetota bacterium]|nr:S8 family serine peptidase [Actinomycetota bacterium]